MAFAHAAEFEEGDSDPPPLEDGNLPWGPPDVTLCVCDVGFEVLKLIGSAG